MHSKLFFLVLPLVGTALSAALPVPEADAIAAPEPVADEVKDVNLADILGDDLTKKSEVEDEGHAIYVKKAAIPEPKITTTTKKPTPTPTPAKKPTPTPSTTKKTTPSPTKATGTPTPTATKKPGSSACTVM